MSLVLFLFYWIGVPAIVIGISWFIWKQTRNILFKIGIVVFSSGVLLGLLWLAAGEKWMLDRKVRELCAKDGGVRVYERVKLPNDRFNNYGQINFYRPSEGENALGPEYVLKWKVEYLRKGNPSLHRSHSRLIRKIDGKLLGESIGYSRGGGDLPGPWQPSSFSCPENYGQVPLLDKVFDKSN